MGLLTTLSPSSLLTLHTLLLTTLSLLTLFTLRLLYTAIYNLYFHPLSRFPGPRLWLILPITRQINSILGIREHQTLAYHEKYGDVVRSGPDMLTFTAPEAWKDIYGHGHAELPKVLGPQRQAQAAKKREDGKGDGSPGIFRGGQGQGQGEVQNIIGADAKTHFRYRRAMLPAFSDKALGEQEGLIRGYIDLLMRRLGEVADRDLEEEEEEGEKGVEKVKGVGKGEGTDIVKWFNYTTFDLISDLAFGEAMGGLEGGATNAWLKRIRQAIRILPWALLLQMYVPGLGLLLRGVIRKSADEHKVMVEDLVKKRIARAEVDDRRGDFMDQIMRAKGKEHELTDEEHAANADIMMIAGSETTATLLSGVTYLLLNDPEKMQRVKDEVRGAFEAKEEITFSAASSKLPYTLACLQEALRVYPPVPIVMLRQTLPNQMTPIAGHLVPGNTKVGVPQLAAFHTSHNWHRPLEFLPERWLPEALNDPKSPCYNDRRDVHRPFSVGPRDCIGRNLAYHEMRLILARLIWEFDLSLRPEGRNWIDGQKIMVFWDKPPLMVDVKRRV